MKYSKILLFSGYTLLITACSVFSNNNHSTTASVQAPPQKISATDAAVPEIAPAASTSQPKTAKMQASAGTKSSRIQETRAPGGSVNQIKVTNSHNIPDYYITPPQQPVDSNAPSSDTVTTPSWKIGW